MLILEECLNICLSSSVCKVLYDCNRARAIILLKNKRDRNFIDNGGLTADIILSLPEWEKNV